MADLYLGTTDIADVKIGSLAINKVYLGIMQIWIALEDLLETFESYIDGVRSTPMEGWTPVEITSTDMIRIISDHTPTVGTGPYTAYAGSKYLYFEASGNADKEASIEHVIPTGGYKSIKFRLHMYGGNTMGRLWVEESDDNGSSWDTLYTISGNRDDVWFASGVNISSDSNKIRLRYVNYDTTHGDLAIDNLELIIDTYIRPAPPAIPEQWPSGLISTSSNSISTFTPGSYQNTGLEAGMSVYWRYMIDGQFHLFNSSGNITDDQFFSTELAINLAQASNRNIIHTTAKAMHNIGVPMYFRDLTSAGPPNTMFTPNAIYSAINQYNSLPEDGSMDNIHELGVGTYGGNLLFNVGGAEGNFANTLDIISVDDGSEYNATFSLYQKSGQILMSINKLLSSDYDGAGNWFISTGSLARGYGANGITQDMLVSATGPGSPITTNIENSSFSLAIGSMNQGLGSGVGEIIIGMTFLSGTTWVYREYRSIERAIGSVADWLASFNPTAEVYTEFTITNAIEKRALKILIGYGRSSNAYDVEPIFQTLDSTTLDEQADYEVDNSRRRKLYICDSTQ